MDYILNKKVFFSKMHGLGNDFVIINNINQNIKMSKIKIKNLSDRNKGIGFDQLLLIEKSFNKDIDFNYRIFNSNGEEVSQCGNGARCIAKFIYSNRLTNKKNIIVSTKNRILHLKIKNNKKILVNMGKPDFNPESLPFIIRKNKKEYCIKIKTKNIKFGIVSLGNPHCVILVPDVLTTNIEEIGPIIENHSQFPNKVNVNFMEIINKKYIKLRVYERDVGETKACGSGACASVAVGINQNLLDQKVTVELPGGKLKIFLDKNNECIYMSGPATHIFDGYFINKNF
ncbi:diaminopimelate epimerase [Buchnera aphidicola]|uniref:diaminopimelate epimerase n=1 Tax=Buchnera aphidicola TaxID=9 RepID=UPI003464D3AB